MLFGARGGSKLAKVKKKKEKKVVGEGKVFIQATFNNTIVTITDIMGNTISWASAGGSGFRGAKKSTPYAAQFTAEKAAKMAIDMGLREVQVYVKGPGVGRESAIRSLGNLGLWVKSIRDVTPIPHNGCRPRKSRRV
ncbi:MAG: 30S ribosomal protein S11 [Spirochaetales bacterium]|jgi:small subunit ribosomal protein S11|nr:30S ribosomal protein S11 [Spirochaetales bacterium]